MEDEIEGVREKMIKKGKKRMYAKSMDENSLIKFKNVITVNLSNRENRGLINKKMNNELAQQKAFSSNLCEMS